jgi:hypothetical protein
VDTSITDVAGNRISLTSADRADQRLDPAAAAS